MNFGIGYVEKPSFLKRWKCSLTFQWSLGLGKNKVRISIIKFMVFEQMPAGWITLSTAFLTISKKKTVEIVELSKF
jgi:hypothetical protein